MAVRSVVVPRLGALARSTRDLLRALEEFQSKHIRFVSQHEGIDTSTAAGRIFVENLGLIVAFEYAIIQERILAGLDRARREGKTLGRPPVILDIEAVRQLREEGLSMRKVAARLGSSPGVLQRALKANFSPQPGSAGHPRPAPDASQTAPALSRSPSRSRNDPSPASPRQPCRLPGKRGRESSL
jgi:DNA invertase Pin-like site-specific DNA recombinase